MKNKKYFDGGSILSLLGGATNLIPKDNTAGELYLEQLVELPL